MRSVRCGGGGVCPGGVCSEGVSSGGSEFLTYTCENITFPKLCLQTVKKMVIAACKQSCGKVKFFSRVWLFHKEGEVACDYYPWCIGSHRPPPQNGRAQAGAIVCEGYVFTDVCLSTGGCLPQCMLGSHPPESWHPPEADTPPLPQVETPPPRQIPPGSRHPPPRSRPPSQIMLGDTVNARAVRILLECFLVLRYFCSSW